MLDLGLIRPSEDLGSDLTNSGILRYSFDENPKKPDFTLIKSALKPAFDEKYKKSILQRELSQKDQDVFHVSKAYVSFTDKLKDIYSTFKNNTCKD